MKKMIKFLGCASLLAFAGDASAQFAIGGSFSWSNNGGRYMIYCDGPDGRCGVVGRQNADGTYFFKASDGSEWDIVFSATDNDGAQQEFNNGVEAVPAKPEEE